MCAEGGQSCCVPCSCGGLDRPDRTNYISQSTMSTRIMLFAFCSVFFGRTGSSRCWHCMVKRAHRGEAQTLLMLVALAMAAAARHAYLLAETYNDALDKAQAWVASSSD